MNPPLETPSELPRRSPDHVGEALPELLKVREVAAELRISHSTVYRLIRSGQLPAIRIGSYVRVHRDDLAAYLSGSAFPATVFPVTADEEPVASGAKQAPLLGSSKNRHVGDAGDGGQIRAVQGARGQHLGPASSPGRIPVPRAGYRGGVPAWPVSLIDPTAAELARWSQLWRHPLAEVWALAEQHLAVASLARLEYRCAQSRSSVKARADLERLRRELGLDDN